MLHTYCTVLSEHAHQHVKWISSPIPLKATDRMTEALEKKSIQFVTHFDTRPYHFMGKVIEADRKKVELVTIVTDRTSHNTEIIFQRLTWPFLLCFPCERVHKVTCFSCIVYLISLMCCDIKITQSMIPVSARRPKIASTEENCIFFHSLQGCSWKLKPNSYSHWVMTTCLDVSVLCLCVSEKGGETMLPVDLLSTQKFMKTLSLYAYKTLTMKSLYNHIYASAFTQKTLYKNKHV